MNRETVIQAVSRVSRKGIGAIDDGASLASLGISSSLGLSLLRSNLEAVCKRPLQVLDAKLRVMDLIQLATGEREPTAQNGGNGAAIRHDISVRAPTPAESLTAGPIQSMQIGLGLDIQDIDAMPLTSDFRSHPFYHDHFVATEIATALLRPDPRVHLCGIFCAKEAAKKSHEALLNERMTAFTVHHDAASKPHLGMTERLNGQAHFRFIVSISHTERFAAAACMTFWS